MKIIRSFNEIIIDSLLWHNSLESKINLVIPKKPILWLPDWPMYWNGWCYASSKLICKMGRIYHICIQQRRSISGNSVKNRELNIMLAAKLIIKKRQNSRSKSILRKIIFSQKLCCLQGNFVCFSQCIFTNKLQNFEG